MKKLSVIILTWNSKPYIDGCLGSVFREVRPQDGEVIVVDNGSWDGTREHVRKRYKEVILLSNRVNKGVAYARNQGLSKATGKFLVFLDSDTVVDRNAFSILAERMEKDPRIGICGPRLSSTSGRLQYSCREFPAVWSKIWRQLPAVLQDHLLRKEEYRNWDHASTRDVGYVIGACQMIRSEMLRDVGRLDHRMFYGVEDIDLCLRAWKRGWRVVYEPAALVTHVEQRLGRRRVFFKLQLEHIKSLMIFFAKHRYFTAPFVPKFP